MGSNPNHSPARNFYYPRNKGKIDNDIYIYNFKINKYKYLYFLFLKLKSFAHYDKCDKEGKKWFKNLKEKTTPVAEVTDNKGNLAGQVQTFKISDDELNYQLEDLKARYMAIEYEIERRKYESQKIVYDFIGKRFKPVERTGFSQEYF